MVVVTTAMTVWAASKKIGALADKLGIKFKSKKEFAQPYPEDWPIYAGNYMITAGLCGLSIPASIVQQMYETIAVPVFQRWETQLGGRSAIKKGSLEEQKVHMTGHFAVVSEFIHLRLSGRYIKPGPVTATENQRPILILGDPNSPGIDRAGNTVPRARANAIWDAFMASDGKPTVVRGPSGSQVAGPPQPATASISGGGIGAGINGGGNVAKIAAGVGAALVVGLVIRKL